MKTFHKNLIFLASALCLAACQEQIGQDAPAVEQGASTVSFKVGPSAQTQTKSGSMLNASEIYHFEGSELDLVETVESLDNMIETKGTPIYSQNISAVYPSLAVTAYNTKTFEKFGDLDVKFDYSSETGMYSHEYGKGTLWPGNGGTALRFFARAPYFASDDPVSNLKYTLTSDSAVAEFDYTTPATASAQKDVLFGSGEIKYDSKTSADNKIELYHVLTGVKFKVAEQTITDNITVTKVEFSGVLKKATCSVETFADGKNSEEVVAWTAGATPVTGEFSQTFTGLVTADRTEGFGDSFYYKDTYKNNLNDEAFSLMFWFIPQNLDAVTATIYFKVNGGNEQSASVSFGLGKTWNAGEIHTYTLTPKGAGIEITDEVDGQEKSNVVIKNTGNMPEYIRVAVIANWVDAKGSVVKTESGVPFEPVFTLGSNWEKKGAYYYYKFELNPGAQPADPIFDKYTVPVDAAPADADHLEMSLAVQAVDTQSLKDYKEAWKAVGVIF